MNEPDLIYLIIFIKNGFGHCLVDNEIISLSAGSLILVNPYSYLHLENTQYLLGDVIIFTEDFFCIEKSAETLLYKVAYDLERRLYLQLSENLPKRDFVQMLVRMFAIEYRMQKDEIAGKNRLLHNMLEGILLAIHQEQLLNSDTRYEIGNPYQQNQFVEYLKLVNKYFKSHHNFDFYAKKLGVNINALGRMCKETAGVTAKNIILSKLVKEIKMLLAFDPRPFSDISYEPGFAEYSAFNSFVRQHIKVTPTELRSSLFKPK